MPALLLVCTGNICRSPMAEGVLKAQLAASAPDWTVESAGTHGYHVGEAPDPRAVEAAAQRGYAIGDQRARQISSRDFRRFDVILGMAASHVEQLRRQAPQENDAENDADIALFMAYAGHPARDVADPFYAGGEAFETALDMIEAAAPGIAAALSERQGPGRAGS